MDARNLGLSSNPTTEELAVLSRTERVVFSLAHRMNCGRWKTFWTMCQRYLGATWIQVSTYNLLRVYGLENFEAASPERPVLLVANHRSFFDMYVVSTILFRRTERSIRLFFPVRGRFFYDSLPGVLVNLFMGWWSMYPPFFSGGENPLVEKREFDKFSMRRLAELAREGGGNIVGFHPEGTRNRNSDPYTYLRAQPGVGKLIKDARPQVVPVFIAGLGNNLAQQVKSNWRGGEPIRVHFGQPLDLEPYLSKKDQLRTFKEIADFVMTKIAELGEQDRALYARVPPGELAEARQAAPKYVKNSATRERTS
ncbi:MAG TPA: lysophospholipid acyltransferase family protein [Pyrinomonadaceae bacterium]|nr:lysophospholipid acyltransferase family protein [Pyrinomonadaceae bacterium]